MVILATNPNERAPRRRLGAGCPWAGACLAALTAAAFATAGEPAAPPALSVAQAAETRQPAGAPAGQAPAAPLPPPRPVEPEPIRLPALPPVPGGVGVTPHPTPEVLREFGQFVEKTVDPQNVLDLVIGRPRLLVLKEPPLRIQIAGDEREAVASHTVITPTELSLVGRRVGTTVLNLWFPDPKDPTKQKILSYLVRVVPDPEAKERLENVYKALANEVNRSFPDSHVCLTLVGDKLVLSGQAKDVAEATQILQVVRSNAPRTTTDAARVPVGPLNLTASTTEVGLAGTTTQTVQQGIEDYQVAGGPTVINLLRVPGEQQVMLQVTVAEVDRTAARAIGVDFTIRNNKGTTVFSQLTGVATTTGQGGGTGGAAGAGAAFSSGANLLANLDNGQIAAAITALKNLNFARTLAEPNLVALNGQSANFRAGGEFPVPVVTGFTAAGLQGVSFVPFGVQLSFTPIITDKDRIRLHVNADVSTKDVSGSATVSGTNVPGLNTRNFQTTVELREGQTLAVAGLIQTNYSANATRVPFFGDLPVVGRFFASDSTQTGEQELVILITPQLVHPVESNEQPPLPGSDLFEPGDVEFYLLGRLESRRTQDYRSPVRTDLARQLRYRHCDDLFIVGPQGHADGKH